MFDGRLRRAGSVDRNVIMVGASVVLLLAAVVLLIRYQSDEKVVIPTATLQAPIEVTCNECGHTWTILFEEYKQIASEAVAAGTKIMCPSCKASSGWKKASATALPAPSQKDMDASVDFLTGANVDSASGDSDGAETDDGSGDSGEPGKPKKVGRPTASATRKPPSS